jgi:REP element-mobilizing transposase RayT
MVHGYHVILVAHGFWLPNDPRGSWSDFVRRWELVRFGKATKSLERRHLDELTSEELSRRAAARAALVYPPVTFTGVQAQAIAAGFAHQIQKSGYTVWACSILPEHTHLVVARHRYKIEQIANLLKGASTQELIDREIHPLAEFEKDEGRIPQMWGRGQWRVFLDSEEAIDNAICYVEKNPEKEGYRRQHWSFVSPFTGLDVGWVTYY